MGSPFKWNPPASQQSLHAKDAFILARTLRSEVTGPFFPVTLSPLSLCRLETVRYVLLWPLLPEETLASGQGGRRGNLRAPAPITIPAHPLYPPKLWRATEGCCHSNGLGLLMPLGLTSWQNPWSSSPRKRSGPLCWTAVYVCTRVGAVGLLSCWAIHFFKKKEVLKPLFFFKYKSSLRVWSGAMFL